MSMIVPRLVRVWCVLLLALLGGGVYGEGPDDDYLAVFDALQAADQTAARGDVDAAREAYLEVASRLSSFQESYPAWHPEIIEFRLRYVRQRLVALGPATDTDPDPSPSPAAERPDPETFRFQLLEARLRQLEFEREELQARLREALAPSPTSGTSPELRRAEERIRWQQKEIDLLRHALQVRSETPLSAPELLSAASAPDVLQARLESLMAELESEQARNAALELVTAQLQARLDATQATAPAPAPSASPRSPTPDFAGQPPPGPSDLEYGRNLAASGQVDEALLLLGRVVEADPESTEALILLGRVLLAKGLPDAAEAVLQRALRIDTGSAAAHMEMARLCLGRSPPEVGPAQHHYEAARQAGSPAEPEFESLLAVARASKPPNPSR